MFLLLLFHGINIITINQSDFHSPSLRLKLVYLCPTIQTITRYTQSVVTIASTAANNIHKAIFSLVCKVCTFGRAIQSATISIRKSRDHGEEPHAAEQARYIPAVRLYKEGIRTSRREKGQRDVQCHHARNNSGQLE